MDNAPVHRIGLFAPRTEADAYLINVRSRATSLPLAPEPTHPLAGEAIHRRVAEPHTCDRCGLFAHVALIAHMEPPRWLDLCAPCASWLVSTVTPEWAV